MMVTMKLNECAFINPKEIIPKRTLLKKVAMENLQPFCRDVYRYELCEFKGGTKFRNGDTIMARITPCLENGKTAEVNFLDDGEIGFGSTEYIVFRAKKEIMDADFLYYLIISPLVRETAIKSMVGSSGRQRVQTDVVANIEVELPPLLEQRRRADILKSIDDKIALNQYINKNLEVQARAIFRHWRESRQPNEYIPLSDVAIINSDTYSPKENWEYVNYLDTSNITAGVIDNVEYIQPKFEKLPSRARRKVKRNDIVYSTVRPNQLHYGIISGPFPNMLVSTGFSVIRSNMNEVCNELIYLCVTESDFTEKMQQLAEQSTSAFPSIRPIDLGNCLIPIPKREDVDFTNLLKNFFSTISSNLAENRKLSAIRDTLLPRLMSGKIDVSSIEV